MNWFSAIRRCEELTYENAKLRKDLTEAREQLAKEKKNGEKLGAKLYEARRDNSRLICINAYLANEAGKKPNKSNLKDE